MWCILQGSPGGSVGLQMAECYQFNSALMMPRGRGGLGGQGALSYWSLSFSLAWTTESQAQRQCSDFISLSELIFSLT